MKRIRLELSTESINKAIKEIEEYRNKLPLRIETFLRRLAEIGVDAAIAYVPVDTGELQSGIYLERKSDKEYLVVADSDHAAFVEFGTGVIGEGSYKGELPDGWDYDTRATPSAHDSKDPTIWYYIDPQSGEVKSTRGQRASNYMFMASAAMRQNIINVAREVFK